MSPLLFKAGGDRGVFDPGQPLEGVLRLLAVAGVVACIAAKRPKDEPRRPSILNRASVGPFTGGLLLVLISGFIALSVPSGVALGILVAAAAGAVVLRVAGPPVPVNFRRALVSPFVMIAGGLYWTVIAQVADIGGAVRSSFSLDPHAALVLLGFLAVFSAVYYAMLIYGPRQVAEPEGGVPEWLLRYAVFLVSIVLGIGWLAAIAG